MKWKLFNLIITIIFCISIITAQLNTINISLNDEWVYEEEEKIIVECYDINNSYVDIKNINNSLNLTFFRKEN